MLTLAPAEGRKRRAPLERRRGRALCPHTPPLPVTGPRTALHSLRGLHHPPFSTVTCCDLEACHPLTFCLSGVSYVCPFLLPLPPSQGPSECLLQNENNMRSSHLWVPRGRDHRGAYGRTVLVGVSRKPTPKVKASQFDQKKS